jgi:hypothetical protein
MEVLSVVPTVALLLCAIPLSWAVIHARRLYGGIKVLACPETLAPVAVKLQAGRAALTGLTGRPDLRVRSCSRWPEKRGCGQECLRQIGPARKTCAA